MENFTEQKGPLGLYDPQFEHDACGIGAVVESASLVWPAWAQALAVFVGSYGFSILFNIHGKWMVLCVLGGTATWMIYLLCQALGLDVYTMNLYATLFAALYAEVMARVRRCPVTPYLVLAIFPLLPGAGVYYTMSLGLQGEMLDALRKGLETAGIAGSLAVGILLVSTVFRVLTAFLSRRERQEHT